ncbi:MAG TPA: hypothetical protein ENI34_07335, partial [candidate division WOR-3 bacterium]|nr:hypothetical protein [candidate division WOR-3 bacterium]
MGRDIVLNFLSMEIHFPFYSFTFSLLLAVSFLSAQVGWGPDVRLTYMQGGGWYPRAACCGDTIHLVWWQAYTGHDEIYYMRSTDAGESWSEPVRLSVEDEQSGTMPVVACNGSTIYVFWCEEDFGTLFKKSTDGGITWSSIDSTLQGEVYQDVAMSNDTIFLAGGRDPGDIIFRLGIDSGNIWLPLQIVGYGCYVRHYVSSPLVNFTYQVTRYCQEIMFKQSSDNGSTWPDSMIVSYFDSVGSQTPRIDGDDSGGIHIVWYDYKYSPYPWTGDIFYRASRDSGNTWEPIDSLTIQHRAVASDILAEGSNLHLVWDDERNGNFEIYYRMSSDLGRTWGPEIRLTDAINSSSNPALACGGGYLHLFWQDARDDSIGARNAIYYKRKDLSGGISELEGVLSSGIDFGVYPNPFSKLINISLGKGYSAESREKTVGTMPIPLSLKVFDVSGKEVIAYEITGKKARIDTRSLPCGVY